MSSECVTAPSEDCRVLRCPFCGTVPREEPETSPETIGDEADLSEIDATQILFGDRLQCETCGTAWNAALWNPANEVSEMPSLVDVTLGRKSALDDGTAASGRRLRRVPFARGVLTQLLVSMTSPTNWRIANLPADAREVQAFIDSDGMVNLVIESAAFDPVAEGDEIPPLALESTTSPCRWVRRSAKAGVSRGRKLPGIPEVVVAIEERQTDEGRMLDLIDEDGKHYLMTPYRFEAGYAIETKAFGR